MIEPARVVGVRLRTPARSGCKLGPPTDPSQPAGSSSAKTKLMCFYLLITGDFTPLGGMDRANHALASYLARQAGAEVHLVAHRVWDDLLARSNVHLYRVPRLWGKHLLGHALLDRAGVAAGARGWPRAGPGSSSTAATASGGTLTGCIMCTPPGRRGGREPAARAKAWVAHRAALADERACLSAGRLVIANSERTRSEVIERLGVAPERIHTVYYGSDPARFRPPTDAERAEAREPARLVRRSARRRLRRHPGRPPEGVRHAPGRLAAARARPDLGRPARRHRRGGRARRLENGGGRPGRLGHVPRLPRRRAGVPLAPATRWSARPATRRTA